MAYDTLQGTSSIATAAVSPKMQTITDLLAADANELRQLAEYIHDKLDGPLGSAPRHQPDRPESVTPDGQLYGTRELLRTTRGMLERALERLNHLS